LGFNVIGSEKYCFGAFISNCKEIGINRHFQRRLLLALIWIRGQTNMQRKDEVEEAAQKDMRLQMRGHPRMKQSTSTTQLMALLTGFATVVTLLLR
jgi:hypothetical protein